MKPKYDFSLMFGSDSGGDEVPRILDSYFVDLSEFSRFYDARFPLGIVRGRAWGSPRCSPAFATG